MAEAAGLVLTSLAMVKPVCTAIYEAWESYTGFGEDAEKIRIRFQAQSLRLEQYERILFDEDKFSSIRGKLIDSVSEEFCTNLVDQLTHLNVMLNQYLMLGKKYGLERKTYEGEFSAVASLSLEERQKVLAERAKSDDERRHKSASIARKMAWTIWQKSTAEKLVRDFERWVKRLRDMLETVWTPLLFTHSVAMLEKLESDTDAKQTGLSRGIGVRKILAAPQNTVLPKTKPQMEAKQSDYQKVSSVGKFDIVSIRADPLSKYLLEYKTYVKQSSGVVSPVTKDRIFQIAAILHEAAKTESSFHGCNCVKYFHDPAHSRFALVYELPGEKPAQLSDLLLNASRTSLRSRMHMAYTLSRSVQRLHGTYGWIHKSLNSDNVLIFISGGEAQDKSLAQDKPPAQDKSLAQDKLLAQDKSLAQGKPLAQDKPLARNFGDLESIEDVRIMGFEYARSYRDESENAAQLNDKNNLYRHPERWGPPNERVKFNKMHDLYALGVVLLELGMWDRVDQLDGGALLQLGLRTNPASVRDRLTKHATSRLGFYAGEQYRDIVVNCLNGAYEEGAVVTDGKRLIFEEAVQVLEELKNKL